MHDDAQPLDDATLDLLVDGELTVARRQAVLTALEQSPDGWRRCALAFLQAQSLQTELTAFAAATTAPPRATADAAPLALPPAPDRNLAFPALQWLAIAACLLVAFGIGWQVSVRHFAPAGDVGNLAQQDAVVAPPAQPTAPPAANVDPRDAVTLVVRGASGTPQRLLIPLVDAEQLGGDQTLKNAWQPPAALQRRLRDDGFEVRVRRRYAPIFFDNDHGLEPMIVPVDDAVVTPVSREVF